MNFYGNGMKVKAGRNKQGKKYTLANGPLPTREHLGLIAVYFSVHLSIINREKFLF